MKNLLFVSITAFLGLGASSLAAQYNESNCRSVESIYSASAWGRGTATGYLGDVITIRDRNNRVHASRTVQQWRNSCPSPFVLAVDATSSGQYSIRFCYAAFTLINPLVQGGTVEVTRNGVLIDRDRLN